MKLITILSFSLIMSVNASILEPDLKGQAFTLSFKDATLKEAMDKIEKSSDFIFIYYDKIIDVNRKVTLDVKAESIEETLEKLFASSNNTYTIVGNQIVISRKNQPENQDKLSSTTEENPQQIRVTGTVRDNQGNSLAGVTILEKNTTNGVLSDLNGNYSINVSSGNSILVFSYIGFAPQEITVGSQNSINISLAVSTVGLEEVVVVGFGTQKKETVTGAITSISNAKLLQTPESSISTAMVGKISGVLSTQAFGAPGQDQAAIRIRGISTYAGSADPLIMVDGIQSQNYNNIDPNEIENITVLKDASATAVYGVRGANGVLLITTKRGRTGKPQISYSSQVAASTFVAREKYMNSYDYAMGFNLGLQYDSYTSGVYTPQFNDVALQHYKNHDSPIFFPDSDWIGQLYKKYAIKSQHNLNISGGTDKVKYFVSAGVLLQDGLINEKAYDPGIDTGIKYHRYNFRSNLDFNITKRLTARVNLSSQIDELFGAQDQISGGGMGRIFFTPSLMSPGVVDGKIVNIPQSIGNTNNNTAPHASIFGTGYQRTINNYLNGSIRFDYSLDLITRGLSSHATISYQNLDVYTSSCNRTLVTYLAIDTHDGNYLLAPQQYPSPWSASSSSSFNNWKWDAEIALDYSRKFGPHTVTGLLLYNQSKLYQVGQTFGVPNGYQGTVGRVTYDYNKRYLAEFDFGQNGTENFAPGNRFGFFPAYSLGWVVSEESFFPKNNIVSFFKLRGSYGEVGNDRVGGTRFLYRPTAWSYTAQYYSGVIGSNFNALQEAREGRLGNPFLTWERAKKLDVGVDLTLWKDKIRITADYFSERRDNILSSKQTVPNILGASLPAYNLGKMKNGGVDGEITFNNRAGKFNYWIKYIFTLTNNKILFQDETVKLWDYQRTTGQRYGQNYGWICEGFYNTWTEVNDAMRPFSNLGSNMLQPGDFRYKDINGDGIIDNYDQAPIGYSSFPDRTFGLSFGGDFLGFDISILFTAAGHVTRRVGKTQFIAFAEGVNAIDYLADRSWTYDKYLAGIKTDFPHLSANAAAQTNNVQSNTQNNTQSNTFWNENSTYVRLKNVELGYTISPAFLKRIGISSTRVYFTGANLFNWDKLLPGEDPETPTSGTSEPYPITKTYNLGINVKF